jgi:prolyl oligopeptidase
VFWINEIGDPEKPDDFDVIFALSPLHNVPAEKSLPATLVTAGECKVVS